MKQVTLRLVAIMAFSLALINSYAQQNGCGVGSPVLENRKYEHNPCPPCNSCSMPENMSIEEILNAYQAKPNSEKVFGPIEKEVLDESDILYDADDTSSYFHKEDTLRALASHMDDYMDLEAMLECINVNCFFTPAALGISSLNDLNKVLAEAGQPPMTQNDYNDLLYWLSHHNIDSIAGSYFCGTEGVINSFTGRADSVGCTFVYDTSYCNGDPLNFPDGPLSLREDALGYDMAELDLFSSQMQGLEMAGKFAVNTSPDLQKIASAINAGVNLFNGLPTMGIELMTLTALDLSSSITVNNDGMGVKVNDFCSDLGMNWDLNAGGMITRNMKGLPDEFDGTSTGIGMGPAPIIKPCGRLAGGGVSYGVPVKVLRWSWREPNVLHIRPTIASITTPYGILHINLDFTVEIHLRYIPDTIEYIEQGLGYLNAKYPLKVGAITGKIDPFSINNFVDNPYITQEENAENMLPYIKGINNNRWINDIQFMSPKMAQIVDFMKGIYNLFDNVKVKSKRLDYEQDEFYYNFDGHAGKFVINQDGNVFLMPHDNIIVTPIFASLNGAQHLASFTIRTLDGKLYEFGRSDGTGVDFTTQTNYVLPNYYTYPELDSTHIRLGPAQLQETSLPFQGSVFCYPSALEYAATYENSFTIKNSPTYTSGWHLLSVKSLLTQEEITYSYEKDTLSYYTNKNLTHDYPNFNTDGDNFIVQGSPDLGNSLHNWFKNFINVLDTVPTEWRFGRASFIYTATENNEIRHRLTSISGNGGEVIEFNYNEATVDIVGKKYCESIKHYIDGNFNKGWVFQKDENPAAPGDYDCVSYREGGPSVSMDGEFGFNLGDKREKKDYPFLELFYINICEFPALLPLPYQIKLKELPHHEQMTEFGSLVQIKQLFNPADIIEQEARKFAAEKNRKFLKTIYELGRNQSMTPILKVEYEGEAQLDEIPKRFSMQQDLWGYYNTNPSGSLLPRMKYTSFSGGSKEAVESHYGFSSMDEEYDVTLGHNEAADPDKCKIGLVRSLEIETKGKYIYDYEPNEWLSESGIIPGAGMRVKTLTQRSGHIYGGNKIISYEYDQPFIINRPVRSFANPFALSDYDYNNPIQIERMIKTSSQPMNSWERCKGNYVGYKKVRERFKGNGYTDHFFKNIELDTAQNVQYVFQVTRFLDSDEAQKSRVYDYDIFNDLLPLEPQYMGLEDSIRMYNEANSCIRKEVYSYNVVDGNCGEPFEQSREQECQMYRLRMEQNQQNYPGLFNQSTHFKMIFNMQEPYGGQLAQYIGFIKTMFNLASPIRRIVRHTFYNLEDIKRYSKKAHLSRVETTRYFDDGSKNLVTKVTEYSGPGLNMDGFKLVNHQAFLPIEERTLYEHGRTVITKIYYPQNSNATDLKMGTTEYDYLVDNKIFIPVKNQSTVSSFLVSGSIRPLKLFGSQYLAHQLWSVKQGDWVLDGTYTGYQYGMPSEYVIACYPILYADEYDPIELVWDARRTLTSRTYEGRTESYQYTGLRELSQKTDADGIISTYGYDARGRIEAVSELSGRQSTGYAYMLGNIPNKIITTKTYGDGTPAQTFEEHFDGFGKSIYKKRNAIKLSEAKYDAMFRQVYGFDITAGSSYMTYAASPVGEMLTVEDGLGNTTTYAYRGRDASVTDSYTETEVTDPNGGSLASYKDGLGNLLLTRSAMGAATVYRYDDYLRLVDITNPVGETFAYGYNAMDKVISVATPGRTAPQKTWYDQKYRVAAYEDANGNKFVNNYDVHNKLLGTAQVDRGTTFPGSGMMTDAVAYGHYTGGLKVLQHTFAPGKSWLKKKEEQIFRHTSSSALLRTTEALTFDNIGRVEDMKMSYPDAVVYTTNTYSDANLITDIENTYLTSMGTPGTYTDKTETVYDAELRPWKTYFTSDLSARRLISQIKYDERDRMITKWLDEDELQEINYGYDFSSKLTAINAPLTTECLEGEEVCDFELFVQKVEGGPYNLIKLGNNQEFEISVFWDLLDPQQTIYFLKSALNYFNLGGDISFEGTKGIGISGYADVTYKVKKTAAEYIKIFSYSLESFAFSKGECCHLAPNDDGDGPGGNNPTDGFDNVDLFAEDILYDGLNIDQITLYNACEMSAFINKYSYNLDHMVSGVANRVRKSDGSVINNAYSEGMTYDLAGNIQSMQRNAIVNFTTNAVAQIDNLVYTAGTTPSKLASVTDNAATYNNRGFWAGSSSYSYDAAGNITADAGKNISITYNPVHLPQRFRTASGDVNVHYTYGGDKIYTLDQRTQPIPPGGHLPIQRWYIGALEIENGFRKVHHHPEGRISVDSLTQDTLFEYVIRDHLGNTAVTFSDLNKNHKVNSAEVLQRNYYYAFGMEIDGDWDNVSTPVRNAYLYNGKEHHNWNGLNWQDYGARWYMPEVGRFTSVDPVANSTPQWSSYAYCGNDPISFVDPTGGFRTKLGAQIYARLNGGTAYFNSELNEYAVDKFKTSFTGEGSAGMFEYTLISRNTGYSSGKKSLVGHWVKSAFDGIGKLFGKIPEGTTNNFEEKGQSHVGDGIEVLSNLPIPANGAVGTNTGSASAIIETGDMLIPAEGGVLGAAAAGAQIPNAIYNAGQSLNSASDGVLQKLPSRNSQAVDSSCASCGGKVHGIPYNTFDYKGDTIQKNKEPKK